MPLFYKNPDGTNDWKANVEYESLIIVSYNGALYVSNKTVPNTIGNPEENSSYWIKLSSQSGDISELLSRVTTLETEMSSTKTDITQIKSDVSDIKSSLTTINQSLSDIQESISTLNTTLSNKIDAVNDNVLFQISTLIEQFYPEIEDIIGG